MLPTRAHSRGPLVLNGRWPYLGFFLFCAAISEWCLMNQEALCRLGLGLEFVLDVAMKGELGLVE
jgi:hypothetical protein